MDTLSWEDYYVVKQRFPNAVAWGQATSEGGGGNVMADATMTDEL